MVVAGKGKREGPLWGGLFCVLTVSTSMSWLCYCTIILQDVTMGETRIISVLLLQLRVNLHYLKIRSFFKNRGEDMPSLCPKLSVSLGPLRYKAKCKVRSFTRPAAARSRPHCLTPAPRTLFTTSPSLLFPKLQAQGSNCNSLNPLLLWSPGDSGFETNRFKFQFMERLPSARPILGAWTLSVKRMVETPAQGAPRPVRGDTRPTGSAAGSRRGRGGRRGREMESAVRGTAGRPWSL